MGLLDVAWVTIALASTFHEKIQKNGDLGLKMTIFLTAPLEAEISRFSDQSQGNFKTT